jgi:glycosyltransferase involved in cell wall biosynthesis
MKIMYYSSHPALHYNAPTGYGTHMREVIAGMRKLGHEVEVVCMAPEPQQLHAGNTRAIKQQLKKLIPRFLWRSFKEFRLLRFDNKCYNELNKAVRRFQPDVIYERTTWMQNSGKRVASENNIPLYAEVNAPFEEEVKSFEGAGSLLEGEGRKRFIDTMTYADRVIAVSEILASWIESRHKMKLKKIIVTPNAVASAERSVITPAGVTILNVCNPDSRKLIGFVGSIFPYHGVDALIRAFAEFSKDRNDAWRLLIVGDGTGIDSSKRLAESLGCGAAVSFTGSVDHRDVGGLIAAMEICVMARSNWYGSPVKIFEYGREGRAVIAPGTEPVKEVMTHMKHGWILNDKGSDLNEALSYFADHPDDALRMGNAMREKVVAEHTWEHVIQKILK